MLKSVEQLGETSPVDTAPEVSPKQDRNIFVTGIRAFAQIALMIGVIAAAIVAMDRLIAAKPERTGRPQFEVVLPVMGAKIELADQRPMVHLFGQIAAARSVDIRASVAGEVVSVNPDLSAGSHVEQGEELFTIDRFDFESALAEAEANLQQTDATIVENKATIALEKTQLAFAENQLEFAQSDLQRAKQLRQGGTFTQKDVDDRELVVSQRDQAVDQRLNNIAIAEARLAQQVAARQRQELVLQRAQRDLDNTVVKAPFPGVVRTSSVEIGRIVSSNDVTVSMYDDNALDVRFTLTDAQYGRIATDGDPLIGRQVDLVWTVGGIDYEYSGVVSRIGADIASERGGVDVYAQLADDEDVPVQLRPGAFVEVAVPDRLYSNAARVPETAIFNGDTVYKIVDGQLSAQKIQLAAFDGADAIIGDGLADGDLILATRISEIEEGLKVRVVDGNGVADPSVEQASAPARGGPPSPETIEAAKKLSGLSDAEWDALPLDQRRPFIQQAREAGAN